MGQNICCGYFAFDRPQMVEMVTWLTQYTETTCWGLKLWLSLFFTQRRQTATKVKSLHTFRHCGQLRRLCIPNLACDQMKQMCAATECDGFVSMPPLISLITCRAELHCIAWLRAAWNCIALLGRSYRTSMSDGCLLRTRRLLYCAADVDVFLVE